MPSGPDFICIGLQKAGTQWLYDQLQFHPDLWMPPIKEFHYFDRRYRGKLKPRSGDISRLEEFAEDPVGTNKQRARRKARPLDQRDLEFLQLLHSHSGKRKSIARYSKLFSPKGMLLSGDITPGYSRIGSELVRDLSEALPNVRVIMLIRDPVQRMISTTLMMHRRGGLTDEQLVQDDTLQSFATAERREQRSYPSVIGPRWEKFFGERFRYFFFDDVVARPDIVRRDILTFLGADPAKPSADLPAGFNRKAKSVKPVVSPRLESFLAEYYKEELYRCADYFGGPAQDWLSRYGYAASA